MDLNNPTPIRVTTALGLTPFLEQELTGLGYEVKSSDKTGVDTVGKLRDAMNMNLHLRTAYTVLMLVKSFHAKNVEQLYKKVRAIKWENIIPVDGYLTVTSSVENTTIDNSMLPNMKVKDAIVDRIKEEKGKRPDSGKDRNKAVIFLYWKHSECKIYINTSGVKLSDRGYRKMPHKAPLRENLGAAALTASGYDGTQALICPMCGSGTFAIEGALIAANRPPALLRPNFSFMHLLQYDPAIWEEMINLATMDVKKENIPPIIATDRDHDAIYAARKNARVAKVDHLIHFDVCDFKETPVPEGDGVVIMNPEYGERLGEVEQLKDVYAAIGDYFKQKCKGKTACVFTSNRELAKSVHLKPSRRIEFWNANFECRLFKYDMY